MSKRTDHPLIPREQTYVIDRKLLSVHSEDRDINKWPNANNFELQLPQTYTNVETIVLVQASFPIYYNTFSNENQNIKITFKAVIAMAGYGGTVPITITISPGFYGPIQLATELQNRLNLAVQALDPSLSTYANFKVFYDEVRQRLLFGNAQDPFTFIYNAAESYNNEPCYSACPPGQSQTPQPSATIRWNQYSHWGLGYNLGFVKYSSGQQCVGGGAINTSSAAAVGSSQRVYYTNTNASAIGYEWLTVASGSTGYVLVPPNPPSLNGSSEIYMEIDKRNYQDEMQPYSEKTNHSRNNDYNGIVNATFAKIPIMAKPTQIVTSLEYQYDYYPAVQVEGIVSYFPPIDKLSKLKFKFRYHDGTLVDFGGLNFNFTIAFYCYRDEIARSNQLRIPFVQSS